MAHYIDDLGVEFNILDDASVTLWIDENSIYLGGEPTGGVDLTAAAGSYAGTGVAASFTTGGVAPPVTVLLPQACM